MATIAIKNAKDGVFREATSDIYGRFEVATVNEQNEVYIGDGNPGQVYQIQYKTNGTLGDPQVYVDSGDHVNFTPLVLNTDYSYDPDTKFVAFTGFTPAFGTQILIIYTASLGLNETFILMDLVITDGDPHVASILDFRGFGNGIFRLINELDQDVDVLIEGSDEISFARPFELTTDMVLDGTETVETLSDGWNFIRFTVTATGIPTTGNMTIVAMSS